MSTSTGTERPTCSHFDVHMYVVQVVELPLGASRDLLLSRRRGQGAPRGEKGPDWAAALEYGRAYHGLVWRNVFSAAADAGAEAAAGTLAATAAPSLPPDSQRYLEGVRLQGVLPVADLVQPGSLRSDVVLDPGTLEWLLVHEMRLRIRTDVLERMVERNQMTGARHSWYNALRDMFVRSDAAEPDRRAPWVLRAEARTRELVCEHFRDAGCPIDASAVTFPPNCGNMSFFFIPDEPRALAPFDQNPLCARLLQLGARDERVAAMENDALCADELCYYFEGRFHTIIVRDESQVARYMPIQFHAQSTWAYLRAMHSVVCEVEDACIRGAVSAREEEYMDGVINNVQYELFLNAEFARSMQADASILAYVDRKWSLTPSLNQLEVFVENLSGYLQRSYQRRASTSSRRQEVALFALSLLQLIALVSVWGDYLSLVSEYGEKDFSVFPFALFASENALQAFNIALPLVLVVASAAIMCYCLWWSRRR